MKKIIAIAPYTYLPYSSGGQKLIAKFYEYVGLKSSLVVISTPQNADHLVKNYVLKPILGSGIGRYINIFNYFKIRKLIQQTQSNYLIIEHPYLGWLGLLLQKTLGIKLMIHCHNIEFERFKSLGKKWWPLLKLYETFVLKKADLIACISEEDKHYLEKTLHISKDKCWVLPYGVERHISNTDKEALSFMATYKHSPAILFFNGAMDYKPNQDAAMIIIEKIAPILDKLGFHYHIIICGRDMPTHILKLGTEHITIKSFVDNLDDYIQKADIVLNPVLSGGGVKTKVIEALAFNKTVISTKTGAIGCHLKATAPKLIVVEDHNWEDFAQKIVEFANKSINIQEVFYDYYSWDKIAEKTITLLSN